MRLSLSSSSSSSFPCPLFSFLLLLGLTSPSPYAAMVFRFCASLRLSLSPPFLRSFQVFSPERKKTHFFARFFFPGRKRRKDGKTKALFGGSIELKKKTKNNNNNRNHHYYYTALSSLLKIQEISTNCWHTYLPLGTILVDGGICFLFYFTRLKASHL